MSQSPIIVALDFDNAEDCLALAERLRPEQVRLKVGKELFTSAGPAVVEQLQRMGFEIFLDLKFHDIPNTVAKAVKAAARLGVWMVNVHASGGERMLRAAKEALEGFERPPLLIGVTVLTSMSADDLRQSGVTCSPEEQVLHLAALTQRCGFNGVVCSAQEASSLKGCFGPDFKLVTPGIRPAGSQADDQRRTLTPAEAMKAGSDYLVIGRPITAAADPARACTYILDSLEHNA